jgi:hypothetical protein
MIVKDFLVKDFIDKGEYKLVVKNVDNWNFYPDIKARMIEKEGYTIWIRDSEKDYERKEYRIPFEITSSGRMPIKEQALAIPLIEIILGVLGLLFLYAIVSEVRKTVQPISESVAYGTKNYFPFILLLVGTYLILRYKP